MFINILNHLARNEIPSSTILNEFQNYPIDLIILPFAAAIIIYNMLVDRNVDIWMVLILCSFFWLLDSSKTRSVNH